MAQTTHPEPEAPPVPASAPYTLAVIMERVRLADRWGTEQWEAKGVVHDTATAGEAARVIFNDARSTQYVFSGFDLKLRVD